MKLLTTILISIFIILLGGYLANNNYDVLFRMHSGVFILIFGYGVYKLLEYFEKES